MPHPVAQPRRTAGVNPLAVDVDGVAQRRDVGLVLGAARVALHAARLHLKVAAQGQGSTRVARQARQRRDTVASSACGAGGRAQLGADGLLVVAEGAGEELVQLGRNLLGRRLAGLALTLRRGQRVSAAGGRRGGRRAGATRGCAHAPFPRTVRAARGARGGGGAGRRGRTGAGAAQRAARAVGDGARKAPRKRTRVGCAKRRAGGCVLAAAALPERYAKWVSPSRGERRGQPGAPRLRIVTCAALPARFTGLPCTPGRVGCA